MKRTKIYLIILILIQNVNAQVIFTVDDGHRTGYLYYAPLLDSFGIKLTCYIAPNIIDTAKSDKYMTWDQLTELYKKGHDIESHSFYHRHMDRLTEQEIEDEFRKTDSAFIAHGLPKPNHFAYPYGGYNEIVKSGVKKYYLTARSVNPGINYKENPLYLHNIRLDMPVADRNRIERIKAIIDESILTAETIIFDGHMALPDSLMKPTHSIPLSALREIIQYCISKEVKFMTISEYWNFKNNLYL